MKIFFFLIDKKKSFNNVNVTLDSQFKLLHAETITKEQVLFIAFFGL